MALSSGFKAALDSVLSAEVAGAVGAVSLAMLVVSLIAIPWYLCRLPESYLIEDPKPQAHGLAKRVLRNLAGGVLVLLGVLMLVLPGQGLLTIFVGLTLLDFPKKREWVRRLLLRPRLFRIINSIRERLGHPPLRAHGDASLQ